MRTIGSTQSVLSAKIVPPIGPGDVLVATYKFGVKTDVRLTIGRLVNQAFGASWATPVCLLTSLTQLPALSQQ